MGWSPPAVSSLRKLVCCSLILPAIPRHRVIQRLGPPRARRQGCTEAKLRRRIHFSSCSVLFLTRGIPPISFIFSRRAKQNGIAVLALQPALLFTTGQDRGPSRQFDMATGNGNTFETTEEISVPRALASTRYEVKVFSDDATDRCRD